MHKTRSLMRNMCKKKRNCWKILHILNSWGEKVIQILDEKRSPIPTKINFDTLQRLRGSSYRHSPKSQEKKVWKQARSKMTQAGFPFIIVSCFSLFDSLSVLVVVPLPGAPPRVLPRVHRRRRRRRLIPRRLPLEMPILLVLARVILHRSWFPAPDARWSRSRRRRRRLRLVVVVVVPVRVLVIIVVVSVMGRRGSGRRGDLASLLALGLSLGEADAREHACLVRVRGRHLGRGRGFSGRFRRRRPGRGFRAAVISVIAVRAPVVVVVVGLAL